MLKPQKFKAMASVPSPRNQVALPKVHSQRVKTSSRSRVVFYAVPPRNKTAHIQGDLHYGMGLQRESRYIAFDISNYGNQPSVIDGTDEAQTIDQLNLKSGISFVIKQNRGSDIMRNYFRFMKIMKGQSIEEPITKPEYELIDLLEYAHQNTQNPSTPEKWLLFLQENIEMLSLDDEIKKVAENAENLEVSKDRLRKNIHRSGNPSDIEKRNELLREHLIISYQKEGEYLLRADNKKGDLSQDSLQCDMDHWLQIAFFRKTSKLGIHFAVENDKVIHFQLQNVLDKDNSIVLEDLENSTQAFPITLSELRLINRTYGHDHPQIDFYIYDRYHDHFNKEGNYNLEQKFSMEAPYRSKELGELRGYEKEKPAGTVKSRKQSPKL